MLAQVTAINKLLSLNDTGETGAHQAGMCVPRDLEIISFFPPLDETVKNPRHEITFYDDKDRPWIFAFIYYNNKFFGGTRNEYRLTRMTPYLKLNKLRAGDELNLSRTDDGTYRVTFHRTEHTSDDMASHVPPKKPDVLRLSGSWVVAKL